MSISCFAYNNTLPNGQRVEMDDGVVPYIGFDGIVITAPMWTWSQVGGGFATPPIFNYGSNSQASNGASNSGALSNGYVDPGSLMAQAFAASYLASNSASITSAATDPNVIPSWHVTNWVDTSDPNLIKSVLGLH